MSCYYNPEEHELNGMSKLIFFMEDKDPSVSL